MLGQKEIQKYLPHRFPFLLVDRILELEKDKRIVGIKNVTINEPFFTGHFPGIPVMPGVLIIEAMAQVAGILAMESMGREETKVAYFMGIDKAKFRRPVVPGDQIRFEMEVLKHRGKIWRLKGNAYVDDNLVAEAEVQAMIGD
ncbi:MAG TPA: 3-hydroxyacyl-ACP dehydratase FabZ [Nitrospinota bacterium]|nr:3-hydroxyacyl-ACP dehydratase FabZ [Nitrospinota bacterium]